MAQSITDEQIQLKKRARRRLVGAIALVLIVVIFLPMVLDNEPKPVSQDIAIRIPSRESDDFNSRIVPAQGKPVSTVQPQSQVMPVAQAPMAAPQAATAVVPAAPAHAVPDKKPVEHVTAKPVSKPDTDIKPVAKVESKPAAAESAHKAETVHKIESATKSPQSFVIQLGAFSSMDNAKQREAKLAALGIKFYTATLKTPSGDKLRVRAGPYASRQEAEKIQEKLKAAGIQDGIVAEKKD